MTKRLPPEVKKARKPRRGMRDDSIAPPGRAEIRLFPGVDLLHLVIRQFEEGEKTPWAIGSAHLSQAEAQWLADYLIEWLLRSPDRLLQNGDAGKPHLHDHVLR